MSVCWITSFPTCRTPLFLQHCLFQVSFLMIDSDRVEQSFMVPACLPAAVSGARLMQSRLTAGLVSDCWPTTPNSDRVEIWRGGRKEAHFQDSQHSSKNNSQSSLSQCLYIVAQCKVFAVLFSMDSKKRKEKLMCKIFLFSHTSSRDDINVSLTVCSSVELSDGLPFNLVNPCAADEYSY